MSATLLEAFRHGAWATKTLIATCRQLSSEQVRGPARGFGSILATLNHVVLCERDYVTTLTGIPSAWAVEGGATDDLDRLEERVDETAREWERILAESIDAGRLLLLDGGAYECSASIVFAQALHHGAAHREQVRAGLRDLGIEAPDIQPWEYALATGRARWLRPPG